VKNMMNFRFGYGDVMKAHFVLDIPGPTTQDMRLLPFERITRRVFPLDRDFEPTTCGLGQCRVKIEHVEGTITVARPT